MFSAIAHKKKKKICYILSLIFFCQSQPVNHFACSYLLTWHMSLEVNMSCSYTYPQQYKLIETFWIKMPDAGIKSLIEYPEYKDRVEYIEDRQKQTAILRLHNVTKNDERIQLKKQRVNLTCETTCSLTDGFIWYKNGQVLKIQSETLQLQSERSDSGRYSCAVRGHEHLPSPAVSITVMCEYSRYFSQTTNQKISLHLNTRGFAYEPLLVDDVTTPSGCKDQHSHLKAIHTCTLIKQLFVCVCVKIYKMAELLAFYSKN
uniref:Ig-like domain-containing protein n=1 Tax=Cyprinus carpio TaxID=7962 RepID=A0A8C2ERM7_CYPCA